MAENSSSAEEKSASEKRLPPSKAKEERDSESEDRDEHDDNREEPDEQDEDAADDKQQSKDKKKDSEKKEDEQDGDEEDDGEKKPKGPSKKVIIIGSLVVLAILIAGLFYWLHTRGTEETDDAYIAGHVHQISARISGTVQVVRVDDNQRVKAGDVLVELDPRDYEVALQKAQAGLVQAQAQQGAARAAQAQARANVLAADAQVTQAGARFEVAGIDYSRNASLYQKDIKAVAKADVDTTKANLDAARGAFDAAKAQGEAARANQQSAEAQIAVAEANATTAQAQVRDAELQLSYTKVIAPVDGKVSRKTVESGQRLQPGQALMAVVEANVWVLANMKETQLRDLQVGQAVEIEIDALKGLTFLGRVDSIQAGSGATFALLPPDNATGNFTKIVQRVPVKIVFDEDSIRDFHDKIVPGLSVVPRIDLNSLKDNRREKKWQREVDKQNEKQDKKEAGK